VKCTHVIITGEDLLIYIMDRAWLRTNSQNSFDVTQSISFIIKADEVEHH